MNLRLKQQNNPQLTTSYSKKEYGTNKTPLKKYNSGPSFTSSDKFTKELANKGRTFIFTNANKLVEDIDKIIGDNLLSNALKKAGIDYSSSTVTLNSLKFVDILRTELVTEEILPNISSIATEDSEILAF